MIVVLIFFVVVAAILIGAARIVMGWVLPAPTMARVDRAFRAASNLFLKLIVVAAAVGILTAIWAGVPQD